MAGVYFKAEDIAAVCSELKNTNLSIEQLAKKIKEKTGINNCAKVLDTFVNTTYTSAVYNLTDYIKKNEPMLSKVVNELESRSNIVNEIDIRVKKIVEMQSNMQDLFSKINMDAVDNVFAELVKDTVEVKDGMLELSYEFKNIDKRFYFLNSDFILRTNDGKLIIVDELEYYYGRKFYTGDLKHNGKMNLVYYKQNVLKEAYEQFSDF